MSTNRKPTHTIWAVEKNGDKSFWSAIGAGWMHEDGDGMALRFKFWPAIGQEVVIRKTKPKTEGQRQPDDIPF
jgi:hypothetical protein